MRSKEEGRKRGLHIVRFAPGSSEGFFDTVREKVNEYFKVNNISPYANTGMWVKTVIMLLLYFVPLVLMTTGTGAGSLWLFFGYWFLMGVGMIGIGTSVMHDANHGTYSATNRVNRAVGFILEIIGGYTVTWKIQHNVLHHTYTNITGLDEDIDSIKLLRFSPQQPRYWYHRYQYIYTWFFYTIMTLFWMTAKDFMQVARYKQHNLLIKQRVTLRKAVFRLTLYKTLYYAYIIGLPVMYSGVAWYYVVAGFVLMHCVAGLFLSCVFQPAHVMEASAFAAPLITDGKKQMEDSWAIHEVANTTDFAPNNKFLSWFIGGLNYQIEHHLFTGVCHVHYPQIAPIVRSVMAQYNIPYHVQPTFRRAILEHGRMLKKLGRP